MTDSNEVPQWMTKVNRRSGVDRRQFSYTAYIPERRSGKDRRIKEKGARTYLPDIEHDGTIKAKEVRSEKD